MSSAVAAIEDEKVSHPHTWIEHNDEPTNGMAGKLNESVSRTYPVHRVTDRKAKRKDDGPLEILCAWVVEHQIGMDGLCLSFQYCRQ